MYSKYPPCINHVLAKYRPTDRQYGLVDAQPEMNGPAIALAADFVVGRNFNPRNISHMPVIKMTARLERDANISSLEGTGYNKPNLSFK